MSGSKSKKRPARGHRYTRYFKFSRTNPGQKDIDNLVDVVEHVDGYLKACIGELNGKRRLYGVIVLRGKRTIAADLRLGLPNFLLKKLEIHEGIPSDEGMVVMNEHPFKDLKKRLF